MTFVASRAAASDAPDARAPEIHRATRNTRLRALGVRRPRLSSAPLPWKSYPEAPSRSLPELGEEDRSRALVDVVRGSEPAPSFSGDAMPLDALARILHWTNGVTGQSGKTALRAAPSAGALYAGEVYVIAKRVSGLAPGVYYFSVLDRQLVELRHGALLREVAEAVEGGERFAGAAACIALTNVFGRYTWKYANRGYRYALIDTGHIGENLRLAARASGWGEGWAARFEDDRLDALLRLPEGEAVCAVHAIGRQGRAKSPPSDAPPLIEKQDAPGWVGASGGPVIDRFHAATRLVRAPPDAPRAPGAGVEPVVPTGEALRLPHAAQPPATPVGTAILARRSPLSFSSDPVSLEHLSFVLEMARPTSASDVELLVASHRVEGLEPGIHRYLQAAHTLLRVASGDLSNAMVKACLGQPMAGSAAVGFLMVGRLSPGSSPLGDRRYRDLLVEAGAIGQRIYLAAEALGLGARNLAAFVDDDLNDLVGLGGVRRAVLHLTMFGAEA